MGLESQLLNDKGPGERQGREKLPVVEPLRPHLSYGLGRGVVLFDNPEETGELWKAQKPGMGLPLLAQDEKYGVIAQGDSMLILDKDSLSETHHHLGTKGNYVAGLAMANGKAYALSQYAPFHSTLHIVSLDNGKTERIHTESASGLVGYRDRVLLATTHDWGRHTALRFVNGGLKVETALECLGDIQSAQLASGKFLYVMSKREPVSHHEITAYAGDDKMQPIGGVRVIHNAVRIAANGCSVFAIDGASRLHCFDSYLKHVWREDTRYSPDINLALEASESGVKVMSIVGNIVQSYTVFDNNGKEIIRRRK